MRQHLVLAAVFSFVTVHLAAQSVSYLGNLEYTYPYAEGGIGDIHNLFAGGMPYGTDSVDFTTGRGYFSLDSVTLEFLTASGIATNSSSAQWINLQLFQNSGGHESLLGSLGNPVLDLRQTPWPESWNPNTYTSFIDFSPVQPITLSPSCTYSIVASMPTNSPELAALLFTTVSVYDTPTDWAMGATMSGDPYAAGEYLIMAVQATQIPEPGTVTLLLLGLIWATRRRRLLRRVVNPNHL